MCVSQREEGRLTQKCSTTLISAFQSGSAHSVCVCVCVGVRECVYV